MGKFLVALILIAIIYIGLGVLVEFLHLKKKDQMFKLDEATIMRILKWPTQLKSI